MTQSQSALDFFRALNTISGLVELDKQTIVQAVRGLSEVNKDSIFFEIKYAQDLLSKLEMEMRGLQICKDTGELIEV